MRADKLPEGWVWCKLGEICNVQSGVGFPLTYQGKSTGELPFVKVSDISKAFLSNGGRLQTSENYISFQEARELNAKIFPKGTVLFAKIGEAVKLNRRCISLVDVVADNNVMGLVPREEAVNTVFLLNFMKTVDLYKYTSATTVPSVRKAKVEEITVSLPPLPEQRLIVHRVEVLLERVKKSKEWLDKVPQII